MRPGSRWRPIGRHRDSVRMPFADKEASHVTRPQASRSPIARARLRDPVRLPAHRGAACGHRAGPVSRDRGGPGRRAVARAALLGVGARGPHPLRLPDDRRPVSKVDGRYAHTPTSAMFLDPRSPACVASTARFLGNPLIQEPFDRLAEIVRTGRTVLPGQGTVEPENPVWVEFAHSMAPMMAPMAAPLGSIVLDGRERPAVGARHRRGSRAVRDRGGEAEPEGPRGRGGLGRGARRGARKRAPRGRRDRYETQAGKRVRSRVRRPARHRAASRTSSTTSTRRPACGC